MSVRRAERARRMSRTEFEDAIRELIARGLIVCTGGTPGEDGATYALAWLPLDDPECYPKFVRRLHVERMKELLGGAA